VLSAGPLVDVNQHSTVQLQMYLAIINEAGTERMNEKMSKS